MNEDIRITSTILSAKGYGMEPMENSEDDLHGEQQIIIAHTRGTESNPSSDGKGL